MENILIMTSTRNASHFFTALYSGNESRIQKLLNREPAVVNSMDIRTARTPLTFAIEDCSLKTVEILLQRGANPNMVDSSGLTPLMRAMQKERSTGIEPARLLLQNGADPDMADSKGMTPLQFALSIFSENADSPWMEFLVEYGANLNALDNNGQTLLHSLLESGGGIKSIRMLLQLGADPNILSQDNKSALIWSIENDRSAVVDLLARNNATNVNIVNPKTGETPLAVAIRRGRHKMALLLMDHGADVNRPDHQGDTPLLMAIQNRNDCWEHYRCRELVSALLEKGADINAARPVDGATPLFLATRLDDVYLVDVLLQNKADTEVRDNKGQTPFVWASRNGSLGVTFVLLRQNPPALSLPFGDWR